MKLDFKSYLIISLTIVVVLMILFWPSPNNEQHDREKKVYQDTIAKLEAQDAQKDATISALKKVYKDTVSHLSSVVVKKDKEIAMFKKKATKAVNDIPLLVFDQHPEVGTALAWKDSVIAAQGEQIDTLKRAVDFQTKKFNELSQLTVDKDKIADQMIAARDNRIHQLEKMNERTFRRKKFWQKVGTAALTVAVVEGAILILQ